MKRLKKAKPEQAAPERPPKNMTGKSIKTADGYYIRPGNRYPYKKANRLETEEIVEFVAGLRARRFGKCAIHREVLEKYGRRWDVVDGLYIPRADALLRKQAALTSEQAKEIGVNILLDVMQCGKPGERIGAEARFAEIFGYNAPKRQELTGADGENLPAMVVQVVGVSSEPVRHVVEVTDTPVVKELTDGQAKGTEDGRQPS